MTNGLLAKPLWAKYNLYAKYAKQLQVYCQQEQNKSSKVSHPAQLTHISQYPQTARQCLLPAFKKSSI